MRGVARAALWLALMGSALLALGSDPESGSDPKRNPD